MGYTTEFWGQIDITPPLSKKEIAYLKKFSTTRRMDRGKGDYFVDGAGDFGQDHESDIKDYNAPPPEQPGLWCQWTPTEDGKHIEWNGAEKFYNSVEWMWYLIHHFIQPNPIAKIRITKQFAFFKGHTCNGIIDAQGEESQDRWRLIVKHNVVSTQRGETVFKSEIVTDNPTLELKYCWEQNKGKEKCEQCDKRFQCYTGEKTPVQKYGDWGNKSFWTA